MHVSLLHETETEAFVFSNTRHVTRLVIYDTENYMVFKGLW